MSAIYKLAKKYYNTVLSNGERMWSTDQLKTLVSKKKLTKAEYKLITGEAYAAE